MFYVGLGRQEWVDGIGLVRMMPFKLGKHSQLKLGFGAGLAGLGLP